MEQWGNSARNAENRMDIGFSRFFGTVLVVPHFGRQLVRGKT